jgi:Uncharacterized alpha/beta hydrolase domain (DUF2235)
MIKERNLVICCDGTSNEFGRKNTNVVRLLQCLKRDTHNQFIYYDPGVGTLPEPYRVTRLGSAGFSFDKTASTVRRTTKSRVTVTSTECHGKSSVGSQVLTVMWEVVIRQRTISFGRFPLAGCWRRPRKLIFMWIPTARTTCSEREPRRNSGPRCTTNHSREYAGMQQNISLRSDGGGTTAATPGIDDGRSAWEDREYSTPVS